MLNVTCELISCTESHRCCFLSLVYDILLRGCIGTKSAHIINFGVFWLCNTPHKVSDTHSAIISKL